MKKTVVWFCTLFFLSMISVQVSLLSGNLYAAEASAGYAYNLSDFGAVDAPADADETLEVAIEQIIAEGGGVLIVGPDVSDEWTLAENPAPSTTRDPSVTIKDYRGGYAQTLLPSNLPERRGAWYLGEFYQHTVKDPVDRPFGQHSVMGIEKNIVGGTNSYLQRILRDVEKGEDRRVYVPTIRGLAVGNYINLYGGPIVRGHSEDDVERNPTQFVQIKELGWDEGEQLPYIVADLEYDLQAADRFGIGSKHHMSSLAITEHSQSDNQSPGTGVQVDRYQYADGDTFLFSARLRQQSNVHSSQGDENITAYQADLTTDFQPFSSRVEQMVWKEGYGELKYAFEDTRSNHALGTSRPIINMNPEKHVTEGEIYVVAPGHRDIWHPDEPDKNVGHSGAVIGTESTGWTQDIVGRFIAIDEPSEYVEPGRPRFIYGGSEPYKKEYRWWHIRGLEERPDGTFRLYVERTRWLSDSRSGISVMRAENASRTAGSTPHLVPLNYIIAPGSYVSDVTRAWDGGDKATRHLRPQRVREDSPRTLMIAPSTDAGTSFDFEPGDPITQAIGQDPVNAHGYRVRHQTWMPSALPHASFVGESNGGVAVTNGLRLSGRGGRSLAARDELSLDGNPAYMQGIEIAASTDIGLRFHADVRNAAIYFSQPHGRAQPIVWNVDAPGPRRSLTVDPENGVFDFAGGPVKSEGIHIRRRGGISGTDVSARNLRGVEVSVDEGSTRKRVTFPVAEENEAYAVIVQASWVTSDGVVEQDPEGFVVEFSEPAPEDAYIHWIMLR